MYNMFVFARNH